MTIVNLQTRAHQDFCSDTYMFVCLCLCLHPRVHVYVCVSVPVFHGALVSVCEKEEKDEEDENMVKPTVMFRFTRVASHLGPESSILMQCY